MIQPILEARAWLLETLVAPAFYAFGWMDWLEEADRWLDFMLFGLLQIFVAFLLSRPFELARPAQAIAEQRPVRTDIAYTFIGRLGILPLLLFVLLRPVSVAWEGFLSDQGLTAQTLDAAVPWLRSHPLVTFALYVVLLDLADYWRHRLQHSLSWWWALHSLHHSQAQMTFWTDDRNHLIDDVLSAAWFAAWAALIGVPPEQFPLVMVVLRVVESFSHANARISFGRLGDRLLVSPRFHRQHHAIEHASAPYDRTHGCNFAVLLPVWDMIFGTARFGQDYPATGDRSGSERLARGGWVGTQIEGGRRFLRTIAGGG
jgi:sterol desaturase/sphingolipid hydroxylase (fatty acid hydroxylase superfamily)